MDMHEDSRVPDWQPSGEDVLDNPLGAYAGCGSAPPSPGQTTARAVFWSLLRYEDIVQATRDVATFVNTGGSRFPIPRPPLEADPPYHTQIRRALQPFFGPTSMNSLEAASRVFVASLLDPLVAAGGWRLQPRLRPPVPAPGAAHAAQPAARRLDQDQGMV